MIINMKIKKYQEQDLKILLNYRKSIDELKEIARLRRIKNIEKLRKEDLIIALLKSASSIA